MTGGAAVMGKSGPERLGGARHRLRSALPALAASLVLILAWVVPARGERAFAATAPQGTQAPLPDRKFTPPPANLPEPAPGHAPKPAPGPTLESAPGSAPGHAPKPASQPAPGPAPKFAPGPCFSPGSPRRVVCLAPSVAEIACALGRADRLVGAALFSDFPEAAARLPRVGSYADPDVERVLALTPDLCLGVEGMTPPGCVQRLRGLGLRVELLDTADLAAVLRSIARVGELLEASPQAEALTADMRVRMDAVAMAVSKSPRRPAVLYQIGADPMHAAGANTFLDELIRLAGGRNVCAAMPGYPRLSLEQAVALRPEAILIPTMGHDRFGQAKQRWAAWPEVPAVRDGRVHILDSDLYDRPGPRLVLGLEEMARLLHPEVFAPAANPTDASRAEGDRTDTNKPETKRLGTDRPDDGRLDTKRPDDGRLESRSPNANQPETNRSEANRQKTPPGRDRP